MALQWLAVLIIVTSAAQAMSVTALSVAERCREDPKAVFPHPTECQMFYNCSTDYNDGHFFTNYADECRYPQLFDAVKLQCEDYDKVDCGEREKRLNPCDYVRHACPVGHCRPCWVDFPSCEGLPDGRNVAQFLEWTPYYAVCKDQRLVRKATCDKGTVGEWKLFSPETKQCISVFDVPEDKGGYLLDCTGRKDGAHAGDATDRGKLYFVCQNGRRTDIRLCPEGQVYGSLTIPCVFTRPFRLAAPI